LNRGTKIEPVGVKLGKGGPTNVGGMMAAKLCGVFRNKI
jgi:hypothetical protein